MSPLMAVPSPQGEKPEGTGDPESTDASLTDTEPSGSSAAATIEERDSSDPSAGRTEPIPSAECQTPVTVPAEAGIELEESKEVSDGMEHFLRLRRRLLISTLLASSAAVPVCWLLFDLPAALSLLVGAVAGLLYLVLLARSVSRLGGERRSVSKVQLLVPVVLVLASARIPQLELVPALVGFLLYKPALLVQAYLDR